MKASKFIILGSILLTLVLIRLAYLDRGYFAIGGEACVIPIALLGFLMRKYWNKV